MPEPSAQEYLYPSGLDPQGRGPLPGSLRAQGHPPAWEAEREWARGLAPRPIFPAEAVPRAGWRG